MFMIALRGTALLSQDTINPMFSGGIGAWLPRTGSFGISYYKDGGLTDSASQSINTAVVRLMEGYDVAIVANSKPPFEYESGGDERF